MSDAERYDRYEMNQRLLMEALADVRRMVAGEPAESAGEAVPAPALETIAEGFGLSTFERNLLLLCAGMELDGGFASLCAEAQGDPQKRYPTFGLALAALPGAHWSALTPQAPLRRWRMIEVGHGGALTASPLRIDETILHFLAGTAQIDPRLQPLLKHVPSTGSIAPSHQTARDAVLAAWRTSGDGERSIPAVQLCGADEASIRTIAAAACRAVGLELLALSPLDLPLSLPELETVARLLERDLLLRSCALLIECRGTEPADRDRDRAVAWLSEQMQGALILSTPERRRTGSRRTMYVEVGRPPAAEQRTLWRETLGGHATACNGELDRITSQFDLNAGTIRAVANDAVDMGEATGDGAGKHLWETCIRHLRPKLEELAQRIVPAARWDDLVIPAAQRETLRQIVAHVRRRRMVYDDWGFAKKGSRGLGISALFSGPSGTGKTMAAEVLAAELGLDLFRIDLSSVVSKYIGETEKNLKRVFDAAEEGGAVLLFDEADALFGKRSEVKDSHDRFANIEVGYLLQRMEAYEGLAILTSNLKNSLDTAFMRRIRFVINFPFPDASAREEIWRRVFPDATPVEGLEIAALARLNLAGGNIRNIALNGAFLAADAGEPVAMRHLMTAARSEYAKLEKPLGEFPS